MENPNKEMKQVMKYISLIILVLLISMIPISCSTHEEVPVRSQTIQFSYRIEPTTDARSSEKNYFYDGDIIYLAATFALTGGNEYQEFKVAKVNNGLITTTMEWPQNATTGNFIAWFADNSDPNDNGILTINLHNDILKAVALVNNPNDIIPLNFQHSLMRIVITGIEKDETITVSSTSGTDGVISFNTDLSIGHPLICSEKGISITLTPDDNSFYLQNWTQPLILQSNKVTSPKTIPCPESPAAIGKSYVILFRQ